MGIPEKIGDIQIVTALQKGAIAATYKGRQASEDREVLLKILNARFEQGSEAAARFDAVASLAAKIEHPAVAVVHAFGREEGRGYVAEEYIEGVTLKAVIEMGPMPPSLAAYVLIEVAHALKAAHKKNLLHLEIKPTNVLITASGKVKVTDFGIASVRSEAGGKRGGNAGGRLAYLSPEQLEGEPPGKYSDLYALGVILFEMLLGMPAFKGTTSTEIVESVLNTDPSSFLHDDESIPSQLRRICQQLIKKKAEQRYQDCNVLLSDLNAFRKSRGTGAVAHAIDMRNYLADPETYGRKLRENTISIRERKPRPEHRDREPLEAVAKPPVPKPAIEFDRKKLFLIVGGLVLFLGGLSFASSLIFSKDGSFGARNSNPNGSPGATSPTTGTVVARKGGSAAGGASVQREDGPGSQGPQPVVPEGGIAVVTVEDEDPEAAVAPHDSLPGRASTDAVLADTVLLVAGSEKPVGRAMIDSMPRASVYLNGDSLGLTPLPLVLPPGSYAITLRHPDFPPFETMVDVIPGRETPVKVALQSTVGMVQIVVLPAAEVLIDGVSKGTTPLTAPVAVSPGTHSISMKHPTLGDFTQTFSVRAGEEKTLQFNLTTLNPQG